LCLLLVQTLRMLFSAYLNTTKCCIIKRIIIYDKQRKHPPCLQRPLPAIPVYFVTDKSISIMLLWSTKILYYLNNTSNKNNNSVNKIVVCRCRPCRLHRRRRRTICSSDIDAATITNAVVVFSLSCPCSMIQILIDP